MAFRLLGKEVINLKQLHKELKMKINGQIRTLISIILFGGTIILLFIASLIGINGIFNGH